MNILYITQWFSSEGGGGEVVFMNVARGMAKKGHKVDVISHILSNTVDEQIHGLKIHRINPKLRNQLPSISDNFLFMIRSLIEGIRIIRKNKIDLIHSNNFISVIVGKTLSKIFNIPLVTTIHYVYYQTPELWDKWAKQEGVSIFSKILGPFLEKMTIKINADAVHTVSKATYDDVKKINKKSKVVIITNGLYPEKYLGYFSEEFKNYIVFIGRLVFYKNVNFLINAFTDVLEKIPDAKLIIIGDGPLKNELYELVTHNHLEKNIFFIGFNDGDKKFELLANSTALVQPSLAEGSSMVAIEAFALGKPVIMSNLKCSNELIVDGINGFTIPPDDQKQWTEKIIMLLTDKMQSKELGKNAQKRMIEKFNLNVLLNEFELLYKDILNDRKT
ncbi:Alpha-D-kanosaminyltransferase [Candidatus Nitrosocosmicus oleophilus]|uniref:Alpha-D-kanosaminyltransferase n=1 Tax=Candidatus Nitrosocosmicus oleophilus TaxID=1353260 RepID=A0A654M163_9ARCH|nr:glycosyltransferase family 4 protein [Candidatus Nitrosocosmicus oleophilus]ALI37564.1 Alpha-D-kanosaminyltransferase [Candidatus Nitrosocosmicus oleophilus]